MNFHRHLNLSAIFSPLYVNNNVRSSQWPLQTSLHKHKYDQTWMSLQCLLITSFFPPCLLTVHAIQRFKTLAIVLMINEVMTSPTCWTKAEKAFVLSRPPAGEWYMFTHSLSRYSVFSCRPGGSSISRAWEIPDCIIDVGPTGALSSMPNPSPVFWRRLSSRLVNLQNGVTGCNICKCWGSRGSVLNYWTVSITTKH